MKIHLVKYVEMFVGVSSGIVIGGAFIALITFLGVIPRLLQLSQSAHLVFLYTIPLLGGTFSGTYLTFTDTSTTFPLLFVSVWGLVQGIFNGMFAAALVEVINVFPLLSRRIGLEKNIQLLLMAVIFGKIVGSLFQWIYFATL